MTAHAVIAGIVAAASATLIVAAVVLALAAVAPAVRRWLRGLGAVAALLASAAEALASAVTGWPRPSLAVRPVARVLAATWRHGARAAMPPPSIVSVTVISEEDPR